MRRFMVGLFFGPTCGVATWYLTYNPATTAFVGIVVALAIWFTRTADWLVDGVELSTEWLMKQVLRLMD